MATMSMTDARQRRCFAVAGNRNAL